MFFHFVKEEGLKWIGKLIWCCISYIA
jgi:hypothetical protein